MTSKSTSYWEEYYRNHKDPGQPSPFCLFVNPFLQPNTKLIELGCGNGRDSISLASQQVDIIAVDQCPNEMAYLNGRYSEKDNLTFLASDMTKIEGINDPNYIYSRFSLHAIDKPSEEAVMQWAYNVLSEHGLFFIEVRSIHDELYGQGKEIGRNEFVTDHYRRFINLDEMKAEVTSIGFNILYAIESKGFAPYRDEDPSVIRLILQKK